MRLFQRVMELVVAFCVYGCLGCFAVAFIAGAVHDFDRRFPNPEFHLTPALAYTYMAIGSAVSVFAAYRLVGAVIRFRKACIADRDAAVRAHSR